MKSIVITILFILCGAIAANCRSISGTVVDASDGSTLPLATVKVVPGGNAVATTAEGNFAIIVPEGAVALECSYVGYATDTVTVAGAVSAVKIALTPASYALHEVVVSARESAGLESGSKIDRSAMAHLQPSSFTDLLELLPGNVSKNPAMGSANTIALRETGTIGATGQSTVNNDYSITSLGTLFVVDGAPVSTDANLQSIGTSTDSSSPDYTRNITNKGVDMRTISTDNIESVEIVRGIPSAEYGNLTSGMVNVRRIRRLTPLTARFKADGYSKLFSVGKGFLVPGREHVINIDAGYLDSKPDPRNSLEAYKRLNFSARGNFRWNTPSGVWAWSIGADFTGSFDNAKTDPDLSYGKIDLYSSSYNRAALSSRLNFATSGCRWLDEFILTVSASVERDVLKRRKQVAPSRPSAAPTSMEEGVHDGHFILGEYISDYLSEGIPVGMSAKASASGRVGNGWLSDGYKAGVEWNMAKNYGRGQVYDLMKPLSASWTSRPRRYSDVPALNIMAAFVQNTFSAKGEGGKLDVQAGLRLSALVGLDSRYYLSGRPYLDPRFNVVWQLPAAGKAEIYIGSGLGLTTKMPTADYLFPQQQFSDLIQVSYYDVTHPDEHSRLNLRTYIDEAINYELKPARNRKLEFRAGINIGDLRLSMTWFDEHLSSGFRYSTVYQSRAYTLYDASVIDGVSLMAPPALSELPSSSAVVLCGYRKVSNGSKIDKRGVEWQLNTPRWTPLRTALTVTGAWFSTRYTNSKMLFSPVSEVIAGVPVSDKYVGLYDYNDGRENSQLNTNFMFDTQIPSLGLIFTTSLQCMWWVKSRAMEKDGTPAFYMSAADGQLHPFTTESLADPMLAALVKNYNKAMFDTVEVPTALYVNLKATKTIGRFLRVSLFVNRILDYLPDYKVNGLLIRRSSEAYFGMELNLTI